MSSRVGRAIFVAILCAPTLVMGDDNDVKALFDRIGKPGAAEFRYQETRSMELMSAPQKSWGYMISGADGSLVKLQLSPQRVIMAIAGGRMIYYDPERDQRRSIPLSYAGPAQEQIKVFRAMLQGRIEELKAGYDLGVERKGPRWTLRLTPKPGQGGEAPFIEVSGGGDPLKRRILLRQADGESIEYAMEKTGEGKRLEFSIQRLLLEALGG